MQSKILRLLLFIYQLKLRRRKVIKAHQDDDVTPQLHLYLLHLFLQAAVCEVAWDLVPIAFEPVAVVLQSYNTGIREVEPWHHALVHVAIGKLFRQLLQITKKDTEE